MNNKIFIALIFSLITFSSQSQWGIAYGAGWGNADLKSYPNFFSSIDYVGDGINGHRLDIYFPTSMKVNLNNLGVLALNKKFNEINELKNKLKVEISVCNCNLWKCMERKCWQGWCASSY